MIRYIIRRILTMPLLLFGVVSIAFLIAHGIRGDPLASIVAERQLSNPEVVAAARARWGLDKSLFEQYLVYIENLAGGDLGISFRTKKPVLHDLVDRLPATLELVLSSILFGGGLGVVLGAVAARFRDRGIDHLARLAALIGSATPVFWSGLILLYVFSVVLGWLPGPGRLDARDPVPPGMTGFFTIDALLAGDGRTFLQAIGHLVLPTVVLGGTVMGTVSRLVRGSLLDVLGLDFITAARARGAGEIRVLVNHGLRNALIPTLTILGFSFAYLITGTVLTEAIFSWPGIGSYAVDAARNLDYPGIMGVTLLGGVAFLLTNLATDIAYALADPRIRLS